MSQPERAKKHPGLPKPEHKQISKMLPEYMMLRLGAQPPGPEWRDLEEHLSHCAECQSELADLRLLLVDARSDQVKPQSYPVPDLSFLATPSVAQNPTRTQDAGTLAAQPAQKSGIAGIPQLVIQFTQAILEQPRLSLAGNLRGQHYCSYHHPRNSDSDLRVTIDVSVRDKKLKSCHVLVSVVDQHEPFEQEGSTVTLRFGTSTHETITDNQGYASFTDIPFDVVPQLEFTITPRQTD